MAKLTHLNELVIFPACRDPVIRTMNSSFHCRASIGLEKDPTSLITGGIDGKPPYIDRPLHSSCMTPFESYTTPRQFDAHEVLIILVRCNSNSPFQQPLIVMPEPPLRPAVSTPPPSADTELPDIFLFIHDSLASPLFPYIFSRTKKYTAKNCNPYQTISALSSLSITHPARSQRKLCGLCMLE